MSIESNFSSPNFCHKLWISVTDGAIVPGSDITAAITTHSVRCPYRGVCVRGVRKWVIERARWPKHKRDYIPTVSPLTRDLHLGTLIAEFLSIQYRGGRLGPSVHIQISGWNETLWECLHRFFKREGKTLLSSCWSRQQQKSNTLVWRLWMLSVTWKI